VEKRYHLPSENEQVIRWAEKHDGASRNVAAKRGGRQIMWPIPQPKKSMRRQTDINLTGGLNPKKYYRAPGRTVLVSAFGG